MRARVEKVDVLGWNKSNMGLPIYIGIYHKPVNGCEIQDSCDTRSQVMMQLKLVKSWADEDKYISEIKAEATQHRRSVHLSYRTKALIGLVKPWRNIWRTVCNDSYFYFIPAIYELEKIRLHFVGVVKTAPKNILRTF